MSTRNPRAHRRATRFTTPAVALAAGIGYLVAGIVGNRLGFGIFGFVLMAAAGLGSLIAARHSETVAALLHRNDERINSFDLTATAFAGVVLIGTVIVMFVVDVARGFSGSPYYQLGALAGLSYVAALLFLRVRR